MFLVKVTELKNLLRMLKVKCGDAFLSVLILTF